MSGNPLKTLRIMPALAWAALYVLAAKFGLFFVVSPENVAAAWPAAGVGVAAFLCTARGQWRILAPLMFLANLAANLHGGNPATVSFIFATANLLEAFIAAIAIEKLCGGKFELNSLKNFYLFLLGSLFGVFLASLAGSLLLHTFSGVPLASVLRTWFVADATGILLAAPLLIYLAEEGLREANTLKSYRQLEGVFLLVLALALSQWIFSASAGQLSFLRLPYILFYLMIWAAVRFTVLGASLANLLIGGVCILNTVKGYGLFSLMSRGTTESLLTAQLYVAVVTVSTLSIATVLVERKRAIQALNEANDLFLQTLSSLEEGVLVADAKGLSVETANQAAEKIFLYSHGSLSGLPTSAIFRNNNDYVQFNQMMAKAFETKAFHKQTLILRRANGEVFPAELMVRPIQRSSREQALVAVVRDLSEELRLEEEKNRLETRALEAQRMEGLGILAAGIAHDYNNLMAAIIGNAEILASKERPGSENIESLNDIVESGKRAAEITGQLLAYAGKGFYAQKLFTLKEAVEGITTLLRATIGDRANLRIEVPSNLPSIVGDIGGIRQVVLALTANAVEAMGEKVGNITLYGSKLYLDQEWLDENYPAQALSAGEFVSLEVVDDGQGMTDEVKAKAFAPFFSTKFLGRGMGLAASSGIVKTHEGIIRVKSHPGPGTVVQVLLPAAVV